MGFSKQKFLLGTMKGKSFTFLSVLPKNCKGKGHKGVRCYLDLKDCAAMFNLKSHALRCFGQDLVESAFENKQCEGRDGSIFAVFAHQGQKPIKISHRAHTAEEVR